MQTYINSTLAVIMALSISGCASNEPMDDQTQTKSEGTVVGTLLGGALGYAIDGKHGAAIGGLLGAGAGYVVGNEVAKRKKQYANNEDFLDGEIAYVSKYNKNAAQYNSRLAKRIKKLNGRVASLKSWYKKGKLGQSELRKERKNVQAQLEKSRQLLADMKKEYKVNLGIIAQQKKSANSEDPSIRRLENEVATLRRNIANLEKNTQQLASIDERLSV